MRPRGKPPMPNAASIDSDPVEITEIGTIASFDPSRRIDPLPNCFSIWLSVNSKARARSFSSMGISCIVFALSSPIKERNARGYLQPELYQEPAQCQNILAFV